MRGEREVQDEVDEAVEVKMKRIVAVISFALLFAGCTAKNPLVGNWVGDVKLDEMPYPLVVNLNVFEEGTFDVKVSVKLVNEQLHALSGTYSRADGQVTVSFADDWVADGTVVLGYNVKRGKLTLTHDDQVATLLKQKQ